MDTVKERVFAPGKAGLKNVAGKTLAHMQRYSYMQKLHLHPNKNILFFLMEIILRDISKQTHNSQLIDMCRNFIHNEHN